MATTSSGVNWFHLVLTSLSFNSFSTTAGTRLTHQQGMTSSIFLTISSLQTWAASDELGVVMFYKITSQTSNLARVSHFQVKRSCSSWLDEYKADLSWSHSERSFLSFFSSASFKRWSHLVSADKSIPFSFLNFKPCGQINLGQKPSPIKFSVVFLAIHRRQITPTW